MTAATTQRPGQFVRVRIPSQTLALAVRESKVQGMHAWRIIESAVRYIIQHRVVLDALRVPDIPLDTHETIANLRRSGMTKAAIARTLGVHHRVVARVLREMESSASTLVSERIRATCRFQRMQLKELARRTGLSVSHLSRIMNDRVTPGLNSLERIAKVLGCDLEWLRGVQTK